MTKNMRSTAHGPHWLVYLMCRPILAHLFFQMRRPVHTYPVAARFLGNGPGLHSTPNFSLVSLLLVAASSMLGCSLRKRNFQDDAKCSCSVLSSCECA